MTVRIGLLAVATLLPAACTILKQNIMIPGKGNAIIQVDMRTG